MISQKRLLLAVLMITIAISLAGWVVLLRGFKTQPNGNADNTNTANTNISNTNIAPNNNVNNQQLNINSQPIDASNWQTYRNEELGFEVKIPPSWKESNIKVEKFDQEVSRVIFSKLVEDINTLTNTSTSRMFNFLTILVSSKKWWEKELSYNTPHPTFIQSNDDNVYSYACCHDGSEEDVNIINDVIHTFRLLIAGR